MTYDNIMMHTHRKLIWIVQYRMDANELHTNFTVTKILIHSICLQFLYCRQKKFFKLFVK